MGFSNIGISGLVLIVIMVLVVFGPKKLPEIGKSIGKSLREFKEATTGHADKDASSSDVAQSVTPQSPPVMNQTAASVQMEERKSTAEE